MDLIQTFCKVAHYCSFTGAAKYLQISAPAVSKKIQLLEQDLGVTLFERTTRRVVLTTIGEIYYKEVQGILLALEHANSVIAAAKDEPSGMLRVKSTPYFAEHIILPRMPDFQARYPRVILDLKIAEQIPHLLDEGLDIVFGMSSPVASNSIQKKISTTRYVFCASPAYLKEWGVPEKPVDLQTHRYITHSMRQPANQWVFASGEAINLQPTLYLNDAASIANAACLGLGVAALHFYQVKNSLEKGELVELLPSYRMPLIPVFLYYHPARFIQPKVRLWIDMMCADLPAY